MAKIYDYPTSELDEPLLANESSLESYVLWKTREWHDSQEANYHETWDEYYRLWRGIWAPEDKVRHSERSRIITPALQQAVESSVSEIEEATFGHGKLFDIKDDVADQDPLDIALLRNKLDEDFRRQRIRQAVSEVLINAAVFGTGIAEVNIDYVTESAPVEEPVMDGQMSAVGVRTIERPVVTMRPVQAKNFVIDPVATCIEEAHGCAIDEFVPRHLVEELQAAGVYRDVYVGNAPQDYNIEKDPELDHLHHNDKVRLTKYFGKVPKHLLEKAMGTFEEDPMADLEVEPEEQVNYTEYVEAIVVIANEGTLLKVEPNPYMMQDRPVVAFQWDITPGIFWGRGVCEKGFNSQKALDTEIRARIDALALTIHPMLAMDATRIPRGHTPQVRPGKMLLTNGNPRDTLYEFNFGSVDQITFAQAAELQKMVQQSTGAVDATGLPGTVNGEATAAGISMSLGAIIKRQKRTLLNFQEGFWIPFVEKAAWRYMQFDPENYPVSDYKFVPTSTLGIMAREYEVTQLVQLLQTTSDQSPMYGALIEAIVNNMNLANREELVGILREASKPDPEAVKMQQEAHMKEMQLQDAQIHAVGSSGDEAQARAAKYAEETRLLPVELEIKRIDAVADVRQGVENEEFQRRLKIAETKLSERKLNIEEKKIDLQDQQAKADREANDQLNKALSGE